MCDSDAGRLFLRREFERAPVASSPVTVTTSDPVWRCSLTGQEYVLDCESRFRPVLLPCQHHISLNAAETLATRADGTLICPLCRSPWGSSAIEWDGAMVTAACDPPTCTLAPLACRSLARRDCPPAGSFRLASVVHDPAKPEWTFKRAPLRALGRAPDELARRAWWEAAALCLCQTVRPAPPAPELFLWVIREGTSFTDRASDAPDVVFGMRRAPQSLRDLVDRLPGGLPERDALPIAFRLSCALRAMHACAGSDTARTVGVASVLHTAVQPDHVLLGGDGAGAYVNLCGLGNCAFVSAASRTVSASPGPVDDGPYAAPELIACEDAGADVATAITPRVDAWGFAVTCLFALTGTDPYAHLKNARRRRQAQVAGDDHPYDLDALDVSPPFRRLLRDCLATAPGDRPGVDEIARELAFVMLPAEQARVRELELEKAEETKRLRERLGGVEEERDALKRTNDVLRSRLSDLEAKCARTAAAAAAAAAAAGPELAQPARTVPQAAPKPAPKPPTPPTPPTPAPTLPHGGPVGDVRTLDDLARITRRSKNARVDLGGKTVEGGGDRVEIVGHLCNGTIVLRPGSRLVFAGRSQEIDDVAIEISAVAVADADREASRVEVEVRGHDTRLRNVRLRSCGVTVTSTRAQLERCVVDGLNLVGEGVHVADAGSGRGETEDVTLRDCEVVDCVAALLVSGCRSVQVFGGRYAQSAAHNVWVKRGGSIRGSAVALDGAELSGAVRCGVYVESFCEATVVGCKMQRNNHYAVQTQPKARVDARGCKFCLNRRGDCSGTGIAIS